MTGVPGSPEKTDRRDEPFIKLLRRFQRHRFWRLRRKYSKAEAWIDMLFMAYYEPREIEWNGHFVRLKPGEFMASYRVLARRWLWSVKKVDNFLHDCESHDEVLLNSGFLAIQVGRQVGRHPGTHVTITNFAEIHRSGKQQVIQPERQVRRHNKRSSSTREKTGRSAQGKSRPSVTTSRLPSCDRKPGDGVSESERAAVRDAIRAAGFGTGGE